ncbi:SDR family oxidoreductase [Mesorhizobium sp. LHD-90]|uniref:SDR family oxidoreductase n=1 Tax=Mesorhizobium sp. LHD-90 TaxID=3071414 RepID=UPI0027E1F10A|nr:SDR family oxidoreductase [Mesorhizobium sp. LHD-90]MDQ6435365.1 SDR family oxidoreductase [Mesorhizobium sp. LHD-90]
MNIDLDGKVALVGGAEGVLAPAIHQTLAANGAKVVDIDPAKPDAPYDEGDPFVLVLISQGANGLPEADTDSGSERRDFACAIRHLAPRVKRVVLVFSSAGLVPVKGFAEFSADQAALASMTRTLAMELGPSVAVNAVSVGAYEAGGDVRTARFLTHTGVKRPATLSEITAAMLFLADPDNGYMTGHTLNVDGGWAAGYARNF